ncbi:BTAD domain-containing putative transcriptional regulator [Desulfolithobacter dissulfuricans]|nr:BTAD domain-containing putative transcriptional regulator [Desulfolithobacter dissulfuricans]
MDFCRLAEALRPMVAGRDEFRLPPRIHFLRESLKEEPSLQIYDQLYVTFLFIDDLEGAYGCVGAAIGAIWASGRDFRLYELWMCRADFLLRRIREVSSLAVASLLGYMALAELTGQGNLDLAVMPYTVQQHWAEKSESVSLRLLHASTAAFCSFWSGDLTNAEFLLSENLALSELLEASSLSTLLFHSCLGLCRVIKGESSEGLAMLAGVVKHGAMARFPLSITLHLYTNYLYGLCLEGDLVMIQEVADFIMDKTILPCNYYHLACMHFCLAIAALRLGTPRKALLHAEAALQRGRMSNSQLIAPIAALIRGQALADLEENAQAMDHFNRWLPRWQDRGFTLFASTAFLELAMIHVRLGNRPLAAGYFERAGAVLPKGESLLALYRGRKFIEKIERGLYAPLPPGAVSPAPVQGPPIRIQMLGGFRVTINGQEVYDRMWKGRRSKELLWAIIALGGTKVSQEKLALLLWPDSDGDRALNNLKMALSRLRKVATPGLEEGTTWLAVKHKRVSLVSALCRVDSLAFVQAMKRPGKENCRELQQVLCSYRDEFLPDQEEWWIVDCRKKLRALFVRGALQLAGNGTGDKDVVLALLEQACHADPLHETVYASLMEQYMEAGYPVYALNIFRRAEKVISAQTGRQPGPKLHALARKAKKIIS